MPSATFLENNSIDGPRFNHIIKMLFSISCVGILLAASQAVSAASWGFKDGSIAVTVKGAGVGGGTKETYALRMI